MELLIGSTMPYCLMMLATASFRARAKALLPPQPPNKAEPLDKVSARMFFVQDDARRRVRGDIPLPERYAIKKLEKCGVVL